MSKTFEKQNSKDIYANASLNDFLNKDEILYMKKFPQFSDTNNNDDIDSFSSFEKNELIIKFLSIAIEKLSSLKETALSKCLYWTKNQVQINLDFKPDAITFKNFEKMKETKPSMKVKLGWLEEYSLLNNQADIYNITKYGSPKKSRPRRSTSFNEKTAMSICILQSDSVFSNLNQDLLNFESPTFNIFLLEEKIGRENILPTISSFVFSSLGLFSVINYVKFETFVYKIVEGYSRKNPYHTDLHAADMVQTCLLFFLYGELQKTLMLNEIDITSFFLSGIVHDYKHPGFTNNYLINIKNEIAIRYNDQSVLENYHVAEAFSLIFSDKKYDIFEGVPYEDYKIIRKRVIECVLATDMTLHNKEYQFLKMRIATFNISKGSNVEKILEGLDNVTKYNMQQEFLNVLIHAADVSNPTKPPEIYENWANRCISEFFLQGDKERERGLKISFLCDRYTVTLPSSQLGFIEGIVLPLYSVIVEYFPNISYTITNIKKNIECFKKKKEELEKNDKK